MLSVSATTAFSQEFPHYVANFESALIDADVEETAETKPALDSMEAIAETLRDAESRLESTEKHLEELLDDKEKAEKKKKADAAKEKKWFEKYTIRGYAQFRINDVLDETDGLAPAQHVGDSSVGENQTFLIRRARVIISGDVNDHVAIYLQPDFASTPNGSVDSIQFTQIRDWYGDIFLDTDREFRFRVGQSKIPYGWENLQSSSNRLPLDRNDAFNSAAKNERDLGAFFYWTPTYAQDLFKYVVDEGLKGSGNYGVFGMGVYNGQGGSLREQNDTMHFITRLAVPYRSADGQISEFGIQGYTGMYTVLGSAISPLGVGPADRPLGTLEEGDVDGIVDKRLGATYVYYPQPLGFQAEWTVGRGPGLSEDQTFVTDRALYGGYLMSMYRHQTPCHGDYIPFVRWAYFKGGYKSERNAPFSEIDELEAGLEWQINKYVELVGMYTLTDRTNTRALSRADTLSYQQFDGELARFQLQVNY
jgi:Phosphate-selective porin O and P